MDIIDRITNIFLQFTSYNLFQYKNDIVSEN